MKQMQPRSNTIPNLAVENIGTRKDPYHAIKGFVTLPCWDGYFLYSEAYRQKKEKIVTGGRIELWVDGEITPDKNMLFDEEQVNAYNFLVNNQEHVQHSILHNLRQDYPRLLAEEYMHWDPEDPDLPKTAEVMGEFDFKNYIGPKSIHIGELVKDGTAYVTWRFRCRWDEEHGLDIVTHNERVIDISPEADPWKIYKDNGTYEQEVEKYKESATPLPFSWKKKKWWQFWK
jgi:hypothetical protein